MPSPAQAREAEQAAVQFHEALVALGAQTVAQSLVLWEEMPAGASPQLGASWLRAVVRLVMIRRARTRTLAIAYYRYVRAIYVGTTIPDPDRPDEESTTLPALRRRFEAIATGPTETGEVPSDAPPTADTEAPQEGTEESEEEDEDDRILVEELARLEEEDRRLEAAAEEEARLVLEALGPANQQKQLERLDDGQPARDVDKARKEIHDAAGARVAAAADRIASNGARATIWSLAQRDKKCIGYVRLSRTGTPCGWCAMLISRGPVYRSEQSATLSGGAAEYDDGDRYHDNCKCYAMPVYTTEQFNGSDLFRLNREYAQDWPRVTQGLSGKAALSAWRRYIAQQTRASRDRVSRPSTPTAQEA